MEFVEPKKDEPKVDTKLLEEAVEHARLDFSKLAKEKERNQKVRKVAMNLKPEEIEYQILKDIHDVDKNILKHRKEDFEANKKFGAELESIHRNQSKFIFIVMFLMLICGMLIGGFLVAYHESILPYIGYALDSAKTMSNLAR